MNTKGAKRFIPLLVLVAVLLTSCAGFSLPFNVALSTKNTEATQAPTTAAPASPAVTSTTAPAVSNPPSAVGSSEALEALQGTYSSIYNNVNPSVVNLRVVKQASNTLQELPQIPGFPFNLPDNNTQQPRQEALGSGFVWDTEGHIVTNNHVISDTDQVTVTFSDGTEAAAKVIGADPDSDLAVVKVEADASKLVPVTLADSTQVQVGQLAIAIGNPYGLEGTMTSGIVSALGRTLSVDSTSQTTGPGYTIPDIIQTDAPINPGNSGGVLLNDKGQVIGVTYAIESSSGANAGIGFAIPSATVEKVVPKLIQNGTYEHPYLGISGTTLTPELAKAMNLNSDQRGALVVDVTADTPADKAGLHGSDRQTEVDGQQVNIGGDVITAYDGQPVNTFDELVAYLANQGEVGKNVTLTILRDGKEQSVEVTLAARPTTSTQVAQSQNSNQSEQTSQRPQLGISGTDMTPEIAKAMNLPEDQQGVLVTEVVPNSPADKAGLHGSYKPLTINGQSVLIGGDVITAIENHSVNNLDDLRSTLANYSVGDEITLSLLRDGKSLDVHVTLGDGSAG